MTIAEHLQQIDADPDAWLNEMRGKVWEMLGKGPPWRHDFGQALQIDRECRRCGCGFDETYVPAGNICPVPPPLDEPPEVVARELRDSISNVWALFKAAAAISAESDLGEDDLQWDAGHWYGLIASPHQQILACLVAGGMEGGE